MDIDVSILKLGYILIKHNEKESKKHLDFGTLAHALFLEPQVFESEFIVLPADAPKPPTDVMRNAKNSSADYDTVWVSTIDGGTPSDFISSINS